MLKNLIIIVLSFLFGALIGWYGNEVVQNHLFHNHNLSANDWNQNF